MYRDNELRHLMSLLLLLVFFFTASDGRLTEKPSDTTLLPYGSLRLTCSSDGGEVPVEWRFTAAGSNTTTSMTSFGGLVPAFSGLFTIDKSKMYDLLATMINNTKPYCGTYVCIDENGDRDAERAIARVATATSPSCEVGETANRTVTFNCSVPVCGNASVPVSISVNGTSVIRGTNTVSVTRPIPASVDENKEVNCSASFGPPVTCPSVNVITSLASTIDLPALCVHALLVFIVQWFNNITNISSMV